ncbi:exodeoxyribonuclease VII large subunit [uncultured Duncaniella sp.]|uniref:exodeoxyribonuclease VII large subunit n=1 Tax=uncultured Duncaniella sp. TaxID=2768039 RepID=UPI0025B2F2BB|nr:exodeoxyribonuclease VII large subunit [uncultured Duncaniella sp.]
MTTDTLTLEEFTSRLSSLISSEPSLRNVWVTAETSDVRRAMHCYLELIQKNPATGEPIARVRATIWRSALARIESDFMATTGSRLGSGMKVRVLVSVNYHPSYGLSLNITDIDPVYTMGDLVRLRLEILAKLQKEGVIELNRSLEWTEIPLRIAIISATGAAGYGDFIHQLYTNPRHLRFSTKLFPAVMQGQQAPGSIIAALESIAAEEDDWDGVVIIRGGGATSDLAAFENYDLAANIAQFPLPVIIGIGHERDVSVLDYVANMRVKTPTAAAEWLISRGTEALDHLEALATEIHHSASAMISASREQLAYISARLPYLPQAAIDNARKRLDRDMLALSETTRKRLHPEVSRLDMLAERLASSTASIIERRRHRLDSIGELIKVLSPAATLKRGYTITRISGHAVTSVSQLKTGMTIETILPDGTVNSNIL